MTRARIRVLIVDEAVLSRDALTRALGHADDIEVVGAAPNASTGIARARQLRPDLLLVAAPLTEMEPEEFVDLTLSDNPEMGLLVLASRGAPPQAIDRVVHMLEAGAFDCVFRPAPTLPLEERTATLERRLLPKIRAFSAARYSRAARGMSIDPSPPRSAIEVASKRLRHQESSQHLELLTIGISTGGPEALRELLPALGHFPLPIAIVIHLPDPFTASLASTLDQHTALDVREARDGARLAPGNVQISAGGRHLSIDRDTHDRLVVRVSDTPPENGYKPSADVLFRSAAQACRGDVLALIMTGMGNDGVRGLEALRATGRAYVIAQDPKSSVVWGMPGAAFRAKLTDEVLSLDAIPARLRRLVRS